MVTAKFFGTARIVLKMKTEQIEALDVNELLSIIANKANVSAKKMKQFLVYVNEVNIDVLQNFKTKLKDGDVVMVLSPSSGG